MKTKKFLPHIITATITFVLMILAMVSQTLYVSSIPLKFMEKLGIYASDSGFAYGTLNYTFSVNGTHEIWGSILKKLSANGVIYGIVPIIILFATLLVVLVFALNSAIKTNYKWTTFLCAVLLPVVFCDFTNLAYFKTLHYEPLVLILLLLICAMFFRIYKNNKTGWTSVITLAITVIAYSSIGKLQAVTALVLGLLIVRLFKLTSTKGLKIFTIVLGSVVVLQSVLFISSYKSVDYERNIYNSVFFGVCKYDSVTSLGLDPKLDDFKEVYCGMMENEADYDLQNTFYNKVSYKTLLKYYITHPSNTIKLVGNEAKAAFYTDNEYLFTPYSTVKKMYMPAGLGMLLIIALIYIAVAIFTGKKFPQLKYACEFLCGLVVMWIVSLFVTVIFNGNCDITTNVYTFNVLFDILLVCAATGGIRVMLKTRDHNKEKFGITNE